MPARKTPTSTPPASPTSAIARVRLPPPAPALPPFSRRVAASAVLALMPVIGTVVALVLGSAFVNTHMGSFFLACTAGSLVSVFFVLFERARLGAMGHDGRPRGRRLTIPIAIVGFFASIWGSLMVLLSTVSFGHGRPLRVRRAPMFAKLVDGDTWLDDGSPVIAPQSAADAWRAHGAAEHASIAAFARLAQDLSTLRAPASLIQAAHDDALDEIMHTRLCFSLARAIDGHELEPSTLAAERHTPHIASIAIDALVDGALGEGTSARVAAKLAGIVVDERVRAVLKAIAGDEGRHARHGWETLAWCLDAGGPVVHGAIHGALRALPESLTPLVADATLERFGIASPSMQHAIFREVRATVVERARAMLIAASGRSLRH